MVSGQRLSYNVYGGDREGACERIILADKIMWGLGLAALCFSITGHYVGSGMVVNNGVKVIKPIILIVLFLLLIKVVLGI